MTLRQEIKIWLEIMTAGLWVNFFNRMERKAREHWAHLVAIHRNIIYGEADNVKLKLNLYVPVSSTDSRRPAVILLHGGAWCMGDKENVGWLGHLLAQRGLVTACVGYRLAPHFQYPAQLHDVQLSARWLYQNAKKWSIDPNAISAFGISAGGHLALLLGLIGFETDDGMGRIHKVATLFAPTDLTAPYYIASAETARLHLPNFLKDFLGMTYHEAPSVWRDASPIYYLHPDAPPCFLINGTKDLLVPPDQTIRFAKAAQLSGVKTTVVLIDGLGHGYNLRPYILKQLHNAISESFRFLAN